MYEFNPNKYLVRDDSFQNESLKIISEIENSFITDSYIGFFLCREPAEKLSLILNKNNSDYKKNYKDNLDKYESLKESMSWDFIDPLTDFESAVKPILCQIEKLLSEKNYNLNKQSEVKIEEAEKLLFQFVEDNSFVDKYIRNQYFNKMNEIRINLKKDNLMALLFCASTLADMEAIKKINKEKYLKYYLSVQKKKYIVAAVFEKYRKFLKLSEVKNIEEQFLIVENIMRSQDYGKFEDALEILDMISFKVSENSSEKKLQIVEKIRKDVENLKPVIWLEDWEELRKGIDILILQAEESGQVFNLNLDKYHIEHKRIDKKQKIHEFINNLNKSRNCSELTEKARYLFNHEASRKDLESLISQIDSRSCGKSEKLSSDKTPERSALVKNIKYIILCVVLLTAVIVFIINQKKNAEHFDAKGQKYADMVEMMAFSGVKSKNGIDMDKIRKKIQAPKEDLQIISIDEKEVVIKYKEKIYKKSVRK